MARVLELSLPRPACAGYESKRLLRRGVPIKTPTYTVDGHFVWGATARMVEDLLDATEAGALIWPVLRRYMQARAEIHRCRLRRVDRRAGRCQCLLLTLFGPVELNIARGAPEPGARHGARRWASFGPLVHPEPRGASAPRPDRDDRLAGLRLGRRGARSSGGAVLGGGGPQRDRRAQAATGRLTCALAGRVRPPRWWRSSCCSPPGVDCPGCCRSSCFERRRPVRLRRLTAPPRPWPAAACSRSVRGESRPTRRAAARQARTFDAAARRRVWNASELRRPSRSARPRGCPTRSTSRRSSSRSARRAARAARTTCAPSARRCGSRR